MAHDVKTTDNIIARFSDGTVYVKRLEYNSRGHKRISYLLKVGDAEILHRESLPASYTWTPGRLVVKYWYKGVPHRPDGPAEVVYVKGVKKSEGWYIDGHRLTPEQVAECTAEVVRRRKVLRLFSSRKT